jgi:hypothetical protein
MPQQWGEPINSYGPPPEVYEHLTNEERIALARKVTMSVPSKEPKDDD